MDSGTERSIDRQESCALKDRIKPLAVWVVEWKTKAGWIMQPSHSFSRSEGLRVLRWYRGQFPSSRYRLIKFSRYSR
jgi:hypothetical protein